MKIGQTHVNEEAIKELTFEEFAASCGNVPFGMTLEKAYKEITGKSAGIRTAAKKTSGKNEQPGDS